jgi:putative ABC transport system ATP-binding protein
MEPNLFRYIWSHTRREQIAIVLVILFSMVPYYLAFDLPKQIVNGPLQGMGFAEEGATLPFLRLSVDLPFYGKLQLFDGVQMERIPLLMALSFTFLALVVVNGLFKFVINVQKGRMGERLLRRVRYELIDRILRFPPARFRQVKAGEISSMVKDEIEPLGGFSGDAFTQPAMLGGQAATALFFIFVQHFWLGMVAAAMAGIQVAIIPRMRRRLIVLGRQRQITARELSGRVAEIVDGIQTIHTNDTSNWERADIVARLGRIFRIRYDIYQWKFLVKFLNNFLAQLTPFFFYSIGGYLTIQGTLDVGQLVAVINAYKELPGPLKELIDWDLARQDMQVKYEQVVEQFEADDLIDPALQALDADIPMEECSKLALQHVSVQNDLGARLLDDVTLALAPGETMALIGDLSGGAPVVAEVIGGQIAPANGRVMLGEHDLAQLPERVTGRMIGQAGPLARLVSGTVLDNVTYALKRRPGPPPREEAPGPRAARDWRAREAQRAGNPVLDFDTDWIDYAALQPTGEGLYGAAHRIMHVVGLDDDLITLAVRSRVNNRKVPGIAQDVLAMRSRLRERLQERSLPNAVLAFEPDRYNPEAKVGENLLFGVPSDPDTSVSAIVNHAFFRETLGQLGITREMFSLGWNFARTTVQLFSGMEEDPELLQWLPYMTADELPDFEQTIARTRPDRLEEASMADRVRILRLSMSYIEPKYRFGLLDDRLRDLLVQGRKALAERMPDDLRDLLQPYDPEKYLDNATLEDNILFGKINRRYGNAEDKVYACVRDVVREAIEGDGGLRDRILSIGLSHDVGPEGRRLSQMQRQKLALARTLIRKAPFYVFNEPLAGADPAYQDRLIGNVLAFLAEQPDPPGVLWVLANRAHAHHFSRVVEFSRDGISGETSMPFAEEQGTLRNRHIAQEY